VRAKSGPVVLAARKAVPVNSGGRGMVPNVESLVPVSKAARVRSVLESPDKSDLSRPDRKDRERIKVGRAGVNLLAPDGSGLQRPAARHELVGSLPASVVSAVLVIGSLARDVNLGEAAKVADSKAAKVADLKAAKVVREAAKVADTEAAKVVLEAAKVADTEAAKVVPEAAKVVPEAAKVADSKAAKVVPEAAKVADSKAAKVVPEAAKAADSKAAKVVPEAAKAADTEAAKVVPEAAKAADTEAAKVVPEAAKEADSEAELVVASGSLAVAIGTEAPVVIVLSEAARIAEVSAARARLKTVRVPGTRARSENSPPVRKNK
jgi:vacuolar-type H+-ATPase subunit H